MEAAVVAVGGAGLADRVIGLRRIQLYVYDVDLTACKFEMPRSQAMFVELRHLEARREGVLFIRRDNESSLRAHARMDMREVTGLQFNDLALPFSPIVGHEIRFDPSRVGQWLPSGEGRLGDCLKNSPVCTVARLDRHALLHTNVVIGDHFRVRICPNLAFFDSLLDARGKRLGIDSAQPDHLAPDCLAGFALVQC
jgi:hypothetical protein